MHIKNKHGQFLNFDGNRFLFAAVGGLFDFHKKDELYLITFRDELFVEVVEGFRLQVDIF